jgi:FkbM family methyltransferase
MRRFLLKVLRKIVVLIAESNSKLPGILEIDLQRIQGKGYGADSVELEAKIALHFVSQCGVKEPVVLDIGANSGTYSENILKYAPHATIYAFEPSSIARQLLENRFFGIKAVKIEPYALGSRVSKEMLYSDIAGSGLASLTKRKLKHFGIEFSHSEPVDVVTLDSWAQASNISPNLIKIDVEGHELDVLKGGLDTWATAQVIQFEFGGCNIDTRTFFQDFWFLFTEAGFAIYRISKEGPIHISQYSEGHECFRTTNYLAVKEYPLI